MEIGSKEDIAIKQPLMDKKIELSIMQIVYNGLKWLN